MCPRFTPWRIPRLRGPTLRVGPDSAAQVQVIGSSAPGKKRVVFGLRALPTENLQRPARTRQSPVCTSPEPVVDRGEFGDTTVSRQASVTSRRLSSPGV